MCFLLCSSPQARKGNMWGFCCLSSYEIEKEWDICIFVVVQFIRKTEQECVVWLLDVWSYVLILSHACIPLSLDSYEEPKGEVWLCFAKVWRSCVLFLVNTTNVYANMWFKLRICGVSAEKGEHKESAFD